MRIIITGATSGIGEAAAHKFAANGYDLILTGRRAERLEELKARLLTSYNIEITTLNFDVRSLTECEKAIASLTDEQREIDILLNNAGLAAGLEHIDTGSTDDWDAMIDTNVKGLLYISKIISKIMIDRKGGHIINLGSIAGTQPYENGAVYCGSKHAVHAISQGMRIDLLGHGIKVSEVRPGMVETEFSVVRFHGDKSQADNVYRGVKPLTAEDIAESIYWIATLPPHMNIDDMVITPTQQANAYYTHRKG